MFTQLIVFVLSFLNKYSSANSTAQSQILKTRKMREAEAAARKAKITKVQGLTALALLLRFFNFLIP